MTLPLELSYGGHVKGVKRMLQFITNAYLCIKNSRKKHNSDKYLKIFKNRFSYKCNMLTQV